ncbi:hypothetical protein JB92DRAFT_3127486 [Gautieria morchelliformis]|nr:hypothetical protein JB92DRAFT_3127486 [Gautieria morchelliformis]
MAALSRLMNRDSPHEYEDPFGNTTNTPPTGQSLMGQSHGGWTFAPTFPSSDDSSEASPVTPRDVDALANERDLTKEQRAELHTFAKFGITLPAVDMRLRLVTFAEALCQRHLLNRILEEQQTLKNVLTSMDAKIKAKAVLEGHVKEWITSLVRDALSQENRTNYVNVWHDVMATFEQKAPELKYEYLFKDVNLKKLMKCETRKKSTSQREQLRRTWRISGVPIQIPLDVRARYVILRAYTIKHLGGALTSGASSVGDATVEAEDVAEDEDSDYESVAPPAKRAKTKKGTDGGKAGGKTESMDTKFWRGLELELRSINKNYAQNPEGYKAYIAKLVHEDNSLFGKKQSAAHALLLACQSRTPPPPIAPNTQLPELPSGIGALESQYGEDLYGGYTYDRASSVANVGRGGYGAY